MLAFFITFLVLFLLISIVHQNDEQAWLRALLVSAVFVGVSVAVQDYGIPGWGIGAAIGIVAIMRIMSYTLGSAVLFVIIATLLQNLIGIGIERYLPQ